ncbi:MAG TPA: peptidylprolyl isomerase [Trebonia sp.]|nr:peptidylprolyl isomerase [Trebonia sp.]
MAGSKERERRRARDRFEQQRSERLERQRRNRKRAGIGLAVLCVLGLVAGVTTALVSGGGTATAAKKPSAKVSSSASPSASASATASASAAAVTEPAQHCSYTSASAGTVVKSSLPTASPDYKAAYSATINTNLGPIKIDLANSKATCTVNSFAHLASANFWNNTQCHRLSTTGGLYMLQCGDPTAKASQTLSCSSSTLGTGGPGYEFASENLPTAGSSGSVTYKAGTVAMANSGGATNGSQFFLVFKNTTLGPDYTPFGTITSGLDILQNVAKAGTSCTFAGAGGGVPKDKVVIDSVSIKKT